MRVNLSVAIVAMVNNTAIDRLKNDSNASLQRSHDYYLQQRQNEYEEYFLGPTSNIQGKNKIADRIVLEI